MRRVASLRAGTPFTIETRFWQFKRTLHRKVYVRYQEGCWTDPIWHMVGACDASPFFAQARPGDTPGKFFGLYPESQGQNLALTVLHVTYSIAVTRLTRMEVRATRRLSPRRHVTKKEFVIDILLVRVHKVIEMILADSSCAMGHTPFHVPNTHLFTHALLEHTVLCAGTLQKYTPSQTHIPNIQLFTYACPENTPVRNQACRTHTCSRMHVPNTHLFANARLEHTLTLNRTPHTLNRHS